jgi:hypothetical protein
MFVQVVHFSESVTAPSFKLVGRWQFHAPQTLASRVKEHAHLLTLTMFIDISDQGGLVHIGRLWNQVRSKLPHVRFPRFGKRRMVLLNMHPDLVVDAVGLPGDTPSDMPLVLSTISSVMDKTGVRWCLVGDILLTYYYVPKIMGVRANSYYIRRIISL